MTRPSWHQAVADAVMAWWLGGINSEGSSRHLAEWWTSDEAPEAAFDLVDVISAALEAHGHAVVRAGVHDRSEALAAILRTVWPDVVASWEGLDVFDEDDIVAQMVADDTLDDDSGQLLLQVLGEQS